MSARVKYDTVMGVQLCVRLTPAQSNSLTAVAAAMSLTLSDTLRAAVDQWIEDIPEPRLFTRMVRIEPMIRANSPA